MELQQREFRLFARLAELDIAGLQLFPQVAHDGGCLKRGQQLGHGVCLLQMLPQQLAVVKVGFVAQQLCPQFEIAVGIEQLGLHFQQAKDCGGQQGRDGHGRSGGGCRPAAGRHPLLQRRGAVLLQPPAGQQGLARGLSTDQQLAVGLSDLLQRERRLRCGCSGDQPIRSVVQQKTGSLRGSALQGGPGLKAGLAQQRDQGCVQGQRGEPVAHRRPCGV